MNQTPDWRERLRDLYLFESPDEDGLKTDSIEFNHGRLKFEQRENTIAKFYFVSQETLESFIEKTIETEKRKAVAKALENVVGEINRKMMIPVRNGTYEAKEWWKGRTDGIHAPKVPTSFEATQEIIDLIRQHKED